MAHDPRGKREELFHPDARYLLLLRSSPPSPAQETLHMPGALPLNKAKGKGKAVDQVDGDLLGYCAFRFDAEETMGPRDAEVVYCYELQLDVAVRGMGLGKMLMNELEAIGSRRSMDKAMLTCLKNNVDALAFYNRQGYTPDEIDPTRVADEEDDEWEDVGSDGEVQKQGGADYVILSKVLHGVS